MRIGILAFMAIMMVAAEAANQKLYLAAGGELVVFAIEGDSGKLRKVQAVELPGVGASAFSPDGTRLYSMAGEGDSAQMATLERKADGTLVLLGQAPVNLRSGYLNVDGTGNFVAGNHYGQDKVSLWKLEGRVYRGETMVEMDLGPRPHGANFSPNNRWLLVPATAANKVFVNAFDAKEGTLVPNTHPFGAGPEGDGRARHPRHLVFHPTKPDVVYTTCESDEPGVCVWKWDEGNGTLEPIQDIVTRPEGFEGRMSTATLRITPDAGFLYVSNRNKEGHSSLAGFRIDAEDGRLTLVDHTPCETVPRAFCIDGTGTFVYVPGQNDQRLGVYAIDRESGKLEKIEQHEVGKGPSWVEVR